MLGSRHAQGMRILRSVPFAFALLLSACGGGAFPVDETAKNRMTITIARSNGTLLSRGAQQFTAIVSGTHNRRVSWSTTAGTVTSTGYYRAPAVTILTSALITATSTYNRAMSATATVTIQPPGLAPLLPISLAIRPATAILESGTSQQFTTTLPGTTNIWSATNGMVTPSGLFTAPGVGVNTTVTIKATSSADATQSASATVTVLPPVIQHAVDLNWNPSPSLAIVGYNVYRTQDPSGPYSKINAGGLVASTLYTDTSARSGMTYYYVTTVVDSSGLESAHSNQAQAAIPW
jgi:hypothetical protein